MPDALKVIMSYTEENPGATHIEVLARSKPKDHAFLDHAGAEFRKTITAEIEKLRQMLERQDGAPAAVEEPMLPVPAEGPQIEAALNAVHQGLGDGSLHGSVRRSVTG